MSADDLDAALQAGDVSPSELSDSRLTQAVQNNPSLAVDFSDTDLTRVLRADTSLIDNSEILDEINMRLQHNPEILNNNPEVKKEWFRHYKITDNGARIKSYDNGNGYLTTEGSDSMEFNPEHFPGARVEESGKLILENDLEISGGTASAAQYATTPTGDPIRDQVSVVGGRVVVPEGKNIKFNFIDSEVYYKGSKFLSNKGIIDFSVRPNGVIVIGNDFQNPPFYQYDSFGNVYKYTGIIDIHDNHKTLRQGSTMVEYKDGKPSFGIYAKNQDVRYFSHRAVELLEEPISCIQGVCYSGEILSVSAHELHFCAKSPVNCVERNYDTGAVRVKSFNENEGDNHIGIVAYDQSVMDLHVDPVEGSSEVTYSQMNSETNKPEVQLKFTPTGAEVAGDERTLSSNIHSSLNFGDETHTFQYEDGLSMVCSDCEEVGESSSLPAKPAKGSVKRVGQFTINPSLTDSRGRQIGHKVEEYNKRNLGGKKDFVVFDPSNPSAQPVDVSYVTGHHYSGEDTVWGDQGDVTIEQQMAGQPSVVVYSSCHTVMNPEYLKGIAGQPAHQQGGSELKMSAEELIGRMEQANPNLRLVIGWETEAPGKDTVTPQLTKDLALLERKGYKKFGDKAIALSKERWNSKASRNREKARRDMPRRKKVDGSTVKKGDWVYDTKAPGTGDGHRVAYYYKGTDGRWRYYSEAHPRGIHVERPRTLVTSN